MLRELLASPGNKSSIVEVQSSVSDPDWIRIQSGQWIRIRIRNPDWVLNPEGQKLPKKLEK
jgi:hypothetical protein